MTLNPSTVSFKSDSAELKKDWNSSFVTDVHLFLNVANFSLSRTDSKSITVLFAATGELSMPFSSEPLSALGKMSGSKSSPSWSISYMISLKMTSSNSTNVSEMKALSISWSENSTMRSLTTGTHKSSNMLFSDVPLSFEATSSGFLVFNHLSSLESCLFQFFFKCSHSLLLWDSQCQR